MINKNTTIEGSNCLFIALNPITVCFGFIVPIDVSVLPICWRDQNNWLFIVWFTWSILTPCVFKSPHTFCCFIIFIVYSFSTSSKASNFGVGIFATFFLRSPLSHLFSASYAQSFAFLYSVLRNKLSHSSSLFSIKSALVQLKFCENLFKRKYTQEQQKWLRALLHDETHNDEFFVSV